MVYICVVFGLNTLQNRPAIINIFGMLIGFIRGNTLRLNVLSGTPALGSNFAKRKIRQKIWETVLYQTGL